MLGDKSLIPTRHELLSMVRKHSKLIGKTTLDEEETPGDLEMDTGFWHDIVDLYFVGSRESRGREDDDLVFFVRKMNLEPERPNGDVGGNSPYFVRRWAPKLDELVGESSVIIDWRRSFYLNLIAHTSFSVTVAICSHQVIRQYQDGQGKTLSPIYKVLKTVYASPSRINFHLDSRKEVETTPAYPDICFAVDDFDSTFEAVYEFLHSFSNGGLVGHQQMFLEFFGRVYVYMVVSRKVLTDPDHCYCVLLNAHDGAAFPRERKTEQAAGSDVSSSENVSPGWTKNSKITLFSGFVSYQMVREAYDAGRSGFGSLLSLGHSSGKNDRIFMKGPGGRGEVEVAVSGVLDQSKVDLGPQSPIQISKKGLGLGTIVRKAASVAKHAYAAASSSPHSDDKMLPLKCCLMSISLPWENIAHDLLFKGSPTVSL